MTNFNELFEKMAGGENKSYRNYGKNVPIEKLVVSKNYIQIDTTPKVINVVDWSVGEVDTKYQNGVLTIVAVVDEVDGQKLEQNKKLTKSSAAYTTKFVKILENKPLPIKLKVWMEDDKKYNRYYVEEVQN
jgi:hypothetical protein